MLLEVTQGEAQQIVNTLSQRPYQEVAALIGKLVTQVQSQMNPDPGTPEVTDKGEVKYPKKGNGSADTASHK